MFTDVLIGDPEHPANLKRPEYITIGVLINRSDRKPAYFDFMLPANADHSRGVSISFAGNAKNGVESVEERNATFHINFLSCNKGYCIARVQSGIASSTTGGPQIDLLQEFLTSNFITFLYIKDGQQISTIKALFPFQRDYPHLMNTELKQPGT